MEEKKSKEILKQLPKTFKKNLEEIFFAYSHNKWGTVEEIVERMDNKFYKQFLSSTIDKTEEEPSLFDSHHTSKSSWEQEKKRFLDEGFNEKTSLILAGIFYHNLHKNFKSYKREQIYEKLTQTGTSFSEIPKALAQTFFIIMGILPLISIPWLLFTGGWAILLFGFVFVPFYSFLTTILLLPTFLFLPITYLLKKFSEENKIGLTALFFFLNSLPPTIIVGICCLAILNYTVTLADQFSLIPLLLWSYLVALAPWMYLASKDTEESNSTSIAVLGCLSYFTIIILLFFDLSNIIYAVPIFMSIMIGGQMILATIIYIQAKIHS